MTSLHREYFFFTLILAAGIVLRFADITLKPVHFDESINGYFVNQIWQNGFFTYSPDNFHGPLLFYLFQISEKIFGFGIHSFRYVTAFFSLATLALVLRTRFLFRENGHLCAATILALSPGMVFFGRSAIHEAMFVFFQILWLAGFIMTLYARDRQGVWWFFTGILGCALLKETWVITAAVFFLSWGWINLSPGLVRFLKISWRLIPPPRAPFIEKGEAVKILVLCSGVWLAFYTGFFRNAQGASDFFTALIPWMKTGVSSSGHSKDFFYWFRLAMRYEWIALGGLLAAAAGIFSSSWQVRFFSFFALANGLVYALIPYKTPWCFITILWPFVFVVGFWFDSLVEKIRNRRAAVLLFFLLTAVLLGRSVFSAHALNFRQMTDPREPYVYVQTHTDYALIEKIIAARLAENPAARNMVMEVPLNDTWPFPWTLSRFPHLRYTEDKAPLTPGADLIIAERNTPAEALAQGYFFREIAVRDAREFMAVYLKKSTFRELDLPGFTPIPPSGAEGH